MENLCIVTTEEVSSAQLRKFVELHGGHWNLEQALDQGVIERGKARVFVSATGQVDLSYEKDEVAKLEELLGAQPKTVIDIEIGHAEGSRQLAEGFVRDVLAKWGGYYDDNTSEIGSRSGG